MGEKEFKLELDDLTPEDIREELKGFYVERMTASRWIKIEAYHEIGKAIIQEKIDIDTVMEVTHRNKSDVDIWIAFAKEFKTVEESPFTKDNSWRDVIKYYVKANEKTSFRIGDLKKILNDRAKKNLDVGNIKASDEDLIIVTIINKKGK